MIVRIQNQIREKLACLRRLPLEAADHNYYCGFKRSLQDIERMRGCDLNGSAILIVGCGYRYPDVALYSGKARRVAGLDVCDVFYRDGFRALVKSHRRKSASTARALFRAFSAQLGLPRYYRRLEALNGSVINHEQMELHSYNGLKMPFESEVFDVVISDAVLEHVLNMDSFAQELNRVTRTGGIGYHVYHNFYSLSGAHKPKSIYEKFPWGHLLGQVEIDPAHLNRMRIADIKGSFAKEFKIEQCHRLDSSHRKHGVDKEFEPEGEQFLTEQRLAKLHAYTREELLTRAFLIAVRKQSKP
jgi:SAM-dependent methyltransferase